MQADVRAVLAGQRQQRQYSSICSVAAALTRQSGVRGLWRGGLPAVQRAALVNLGELSTYDSVSVTGLLLSCLCWWCCMSPTATGCCSLCRGCVCVHS
jgi:solute carrier family 25 uncoupling protein 27